MGVPLVPLHMTPLSSAMYDPLLSRFGADRLALAPIAWASGSGHFRPTYTPERAGVPVCYP